MESIGWQKGAGRGWKVMVRKFGGFWVGKGGCYGGVRVTGGKIGRVMGGRRGRFMVGRVGGLWWGKGRVKDGKRGRLRVRKGEVMVAKAGGLWMGKGGGLW